METTQKRSYNPVLKPQERILSFTSGLTRYKEENADMVNNEFLRGFKYAEELAKIWFRDEIENL